jgi:hypothetical protein
VVDLDREQDIEELRRIAHAQQAQIRMLLEAIAKQNKELAAYKGTKGDAQLTLKRYRRRRRLPTKRSHERKRRRPSPRARHARRGGRPSNRGCPLSSKNSCSTMPTAPVRAAVVDSPR